MGILVSPLQEAGREATMFKIIAAVLFATAVSSAATIAPGLTGQAEPVGPHRSLKGDRLQIDPGRASLPANRVAVPQDHLRGRPATTRLSTS